MTPGRRTLTALLTLGLAVLVAGSPARADEIRLRSGEVLFGRAEADAKGNLVVTTPAGRRKVRAKAVQERIEGEAPAEAVVRREKALAADDADGRVALARFAWSRRLDEHSTRLAEAAVGIDPDHAGARAWLGQVRTANGWAAGWPAPWAPAGRVGARWTSMPVDRAARRALDWLAAHQDEDGRIDADGFDKHCPKGAACGGAGGGHHGERVRCAFDGVTTALAVLAWLAEGSGPTAGRYRVEVERGLAFCRTAARSSLEGFDSIWNVAYATQAVADACLVTRAPALRDDLQEAVAVLLARQRADGGWSYAYQVGDVPTTSAVLVALGLAAQAGVGIERARLTRALSFLEARVDRKTHKSEYHDGAERRGYTPTTANAAATLAARKALGVLAETRSLGRRITAATGRKKPRWAIEFKEVKAPDGRLVQAQIGNLYPYVWYLTGFALAGRSASVGHRKALAAAFRAGQGDEGHEDGSWEPLGPYSDSGGRAFVTGLGALTLLAPRRYPWAR